ncbi:TSUP family transporter [Betaproteobacteria bacterium LSUCC0115]|jgi:uncharacterized membrane protein YfcA|nr:TSUP family transporter [Burkholderiales bacterium LSUCC0115]
MMALLPDTGILLAGVVVCFIGGLLGGLSGAGTGLIVAGFLTPIIGAKAVMPALAVIMLINNGSRVFYYRQGVHWKLAAGMTAIALPGTWMGAHLYMALSVPTLEFILGLAILAVLAFRFAKRHHQIHGPAIDRARSKWWIGGPMSLLYGFLNSLVPGSGVMILAFFSAIGLPAVAVIATDALISLALNLAKIGLFQKLDGFPDHLFLLAVFCGLASVPGVWFARWLSHRLHHKTQQGLIELVIAGSAAHLLFRAMTE